MRHSVYRFVNLLIHEINLVLRCYRIGIAFQLIYCFYNMNLVHALQALKTVVLVFRLFSTPLLYTSWTSFVFFEGVLMSNFFHWLALSAGTFGILGTRLCMAGTGIIRMMRKLWFDAQIFLRLMIRLVFHLQ